METQKIKPAPTLRALRIAAIKSELRDFGCKCDIYPPDREIWVTHLETGWRGYTPRYHHTDLQSIEEAWRYALEIAQGMDADFHAGKI